MRKILVIFVMCFALLSSAYAQQTVTGTVTGDDGLGIPGASIIQKGTSNGTITDIDGNYTLSVPSDAVLMFSFVGMETIEEPLNGRSTIDVLLTTSAIGIDEVVVTALGIKREKKALGYSVTEVKGEELIENKTPSVATMLSGKVAGVNVSSTATGSAGSTRVIIRGNSSISGNNQPLYVVDGVPIDNTQLGSAGMWGGSDKGDGIRSMNPDDIESISVLKGNTAAALYGSRASNGVILITTKGGSSRRGLGIEFNSNFVVDQILDYTDYQNEYGHGSRGAKPTTEEEALEFGTSSWGAKLDGSNVMQFDGVSRPYSDAGDNFSRFYRAGSTLTNTLALSGGNETQTFRFSMSSLNNESVIPNSGFDKYTFLVKYHAEFAEKLVVDAKFNYFREESKNRPLLSDSPRNANSSINALPASINVNDLKGPTEELGTDEDGMELRHNSNIYSTNPWYAAYQVSDQDRRDRVMGTTSLRFNFTEWLYLQGRLGIDWYSLGAQSIEPYGLSYKPLGGMRESNQTREEMNLDLLLGFDKEFGKIAVNALAGTNSMRRTYEYLAFSGSNFAIPFFHDVSNLENKSPSHSYSKSGTNSVFGQLEVSYNRFLYLTATGRQDWFSTLDGRSIFYPSIGASFLFSEAFEMPDWMTFGKVRASWAQVGGGADSPYQTNLTYSVVGQGHMGATLGRITQGVIPNMNLLPITTTEYELGLDANFFDNRLSVDFAIYDRKTTDDILQAGVSQTTGYGSAWINVGEMTNKGIELLIAGTPVRNNDFQWEVSFNLAKNNNEVTGLLTKEIDEETGLGETTRVGESRTRNAYIHHTVGLPYSQIYGWKYERINGEIVYDSDGFPVRGEFGPLGNGVHDVTMGLSNNFHYKNWSLGFLIDIQTGGNIFSGTNAGAIGAGLHKMTLEGRENGLTVTGVDADGNSFSKNIPAADVQDYYGNLRSRITELNVYDADFAKLRNFTLGYNLPSSLLKNTPVKYAKISLVGTNLLTLWSKVDNVDPESNYSSGNAQGLELAGVPLYRSYGFNINVKF
ncbi:MAG: SusC/RagA family TonB-linked outer membrane protein [Bacteroidota bacterium]